MDINSLDHFVEAQEKMYPTAMKEIRLPLFQNYA